MHALRKLAGGHNSRPAHADALIKARHARERRDAKSIADRYCSRETYVPQHHTEQERPS